MKEHGERRRPVKVVLTRESEDNRALAALLEPEGIDVIDYPCIAIRPIRPPETLIRALEGGDAFKSVVFTSRRGAAIFMESPGAGREALAKTLVAAVGGKTAETLAAFGVRVDVAAAEQTGESLARDLLARLGPGDRVLHVRGNLTTGVLARTLEAGGVSVAELVVYENVRPELAPLEEDARYVVVCASPSAAERFLEANPWARSGRFIAIGPVTAGRLKELGVRDVAQAPAPDNLSLRDMVRSAVGD